MGIGCRIYRELNFALTREVGAREVGARETGICSHGMSLCVKHKDMATFAKIS